MTFWIKKTRPQNTMTWPQNLEDLNFRGCPQTLLQRTPCDGPTLKSWIRPSSGRVPTIAICFHVFYRTARLPKGYANNSFPASEKQTVR